MINDKTNLLQDIKALDSNILQHADYVKIYSFMDNTIINKDSFTLIHIHYIAELSILRQFLSERYKSYENIPVTRQNAKRNTLKYLTQGSHLSYTYTLFNTSKVRVISKKLRNKDRMNIFLEILNRVSNAKIGTIQIRSFG